MLSIMIKMFAFISTFVILIQKHLEIMCLKVEYFSYIGQIYI